MMWIQILVPGQLMGIPIQVTRLLIQIIIVITVINEELDRNYLKLPISTIDPFFQKKCKYIWRFITSVYLNSDVLQLKGIQRC